jgi:hypothetical protein
MPVFETFASPVGTTDPGYSSARTIDSDFDIRISSFYELVSIRARQAEGWSIHD